MSTSDKIFNPYGRKHFRRRYFHREVQLGAVVLGGLCCVGGWVGWRGAHPGPERVSDPLALLDPGQPVASRGPLPADLAPAGWTESGLATFDEESLYEKINGRASFFTSRGFARLTFASLRSPDGAVIDIECFDMDSANNALGVYAAERSEEVEVHQEDGALWHIERNALYLAKNRYYIRMIGSDESPEVRDALAHVQRQLSASIGAVQRPWGHVLFGDGLGLAVGEIEFHERNAFSFEFGTAVFSVLLDDGMTELFATVAEDDPEALAAAFREGFATLGTEVTLGDTIWAKDRYLGAYSTAAVTGTTVFGVRGAPSPEVAEASLHRLSEAIAALDPAGGK